MNNRYRSWHEVWTMFKILIALIIVYIKLIVYDLIHKQYNHIEGKFFDSAVLIKFKE